jgi:hypothetical protein
MDFPTPNERENIFNIHLKKRGKFNTQLNAKQLAELTTDRLIQVINNTHPLKSVMKDKVQEYQDKFKSLKIKAAS